MLANLSSVAVRENDTNQVVMQCLAEGTGSIWYHWEKYELSSRTWKNLSHQASPNLTFSIIREEDQGIYRCVATNYDGSTKSNNATLRVYGTYHICVQVYLRTYYMQ